MNRGERTYRDPRRGLPSLAQRRRTNIPVEEDKVGPPADADRPVRLVTDSYRFQIGQNVRMSLGAIHRGKSIACKIVKLLPFEGVYFQYRVKSADEPFERIANEHDLITVPSVF